MIVPTETVIFLRGCHSLWWWARFIGCLDVEGVDFQKRSFRVQSETKMLIDHRVENLWTRQTRIKIIRGLRLHPSGGKSYWELLGSSDEGKKKLICEMSSIWHVWRTFFFSCFHSMLSTSLENFSLCIQKCPLRPLTPRKKQSTQQQQQKMLSN